MPVLIYRTHGA